MKFKFLKIIPLLLLITLMSTGCREICRNKYSYGVDQPNEIDEKVLSRIVFEEATALKYKYHFFLEDSYFCYVDKIRKIRLDFSTMDIVEMCEARHILVDVVDSFLANVNGHPELRDRLEPRPFTPDELEVNIRFISYFPRYVDGMYMGWMQLRNGISYFYAANAQDSNDPYWNKRSEYYWKSRLFSKAQLEAEAKYREEQSELPAVDIDEGEQFFLDIEGARNR